MIKLFGVGNILLCDDAVGVRVLEKLMPFIKDLSPPIEALIGETDYLFCLDNINKDDFVIIIDATYLNIAPGSVNYFTFLECNPLMMPSQSAHEMTLLKILRTEYPKIKGYLIGIEIEKIAFSLELSLLLQHRLESICSEILHFLESVVKIYA